MARTYNEYYLGWQEINRIIACAKNLKERVILKILARTGMRRFELANLRVKDVDFDRKRIYISKGKGGTDEDPKSRIVPIDDDTLQDIKFYLEGRRAGILIQSNKKAHDGISLSAINRITEGAAERAGIRNPNPKLKHLNPHIFRHSFSRLSLMEGIPFNIVQKIVGHADARTTLQMYGVPSINDAQHMYNEKLTMRFHQKVSLEEDNKLSKFTSDRS
ncbi:tyrosine-type recombinase/integrase [Candidatus Woesearchaeota archaeon]|nr:tyrosine-type recombinase/integrase [Candidatus Woesearchaeota archaeon]